MGRGTDRYASGLQRAFQCCSILCPFEQWQTTRRFLNGWDVSPRASSSHNFSSSFAATSLLQAPIFARFREDTRQEPKNWQMRTFRLRIARLRGLSSTAGGLECSQPKPNNLNTKPENPENSFRHPVRLLPRSAPGHQGNPELNNTQTRTSLARSVAILVQRVLASGFREV